jgi:N6-L-threonylcarbamoyladenine synthase
MRILGLETSCDETAVALVVGHAGRLVIEKSLVSSQVKLHAQYGGVVPEVAARQHVEAIMPMLLAAGVPRDGAGVDAIAVTAGPGLLPSLRIGVELAKALAFAWGKPLVPVNHLSGHIYSVWFNDLLPAFPALALLVSGGHTELILMRGHGQYEVVGATRDDAAGEAFDKVGKLLGLGYPGGPAVSATAQAGDPNAVILPRPMLKSDDLDFSFSGLKTAVAVYLKEHLAVKVADVAAGFQDAVVDTLVAKTMTAVKKYSPASLILCGGVSANAQLRVTLGDQLRATAPLATYHVPELSLTGDNAAMVAAAGYFSAREGKFVEPTTLVPSASLSL